MFYDWPAGEVFLILPTRGEGAFRGRLGGARQPLNEGSQRRPGAVGCSFRGER